MKLTAMGRMLFFRKCRSKVGAGKRPERHFRAELGHIQRRRYTTTFIAAQTVKIIETAKVYRYLLR